MTRRGSGFTLVEVLVALFVMSLIAAMAWQGVSNIVIARDISQQRLDTVLRAQTVLAQWEQDLAMVQDSQGLVADRSTEHLTATDAAVVRFRRVVMSAARALVEGTAPAAATDGAAYRLRSGSWIAARDKPLTDVMIERFGDRAGRAVDAREPA